MAFNELTRLIGRGDFINWMVSMCELAGMRVFTASVSTADFTWLRIDKWLDDSDVGYNVNGSRCGARGDTDRASSNRAVMPADCTVNNRSVSGTDCLRLR